MSNPSLPEDSAKITPYAFWQENLATWTEFGQRTSALWKERAARMTAIPPIDETEAETLTAEMLRTMSDFNLRHWQNMARLLDTMPDWMNTPNLINGGSITDWFDRFQTRDPGHTTTKAAKTASTPVAAPRQPVAIAKPKGKADDLTRIKGIGPKLSSKLNELGIYHFKQIADWSDPEAEWIDDYLSFKGRVAREDWIAQARKFIANGSGLAH